MRDEAYFVGPLDSPGPGVLLLHSWWGLSSFFKQTADRLADAGFTVLAPDLNFGSRFIDPHLAQQHLADADAGRLASLTLASAALLQEKTADSTAPIGVLGFSMGASMGLWASVRRPDLISAVVAFYGTQNIDFAGSRAGYQIHFADEDDLVSDDDAGFMEATLSLESLPVEVFRYPGTRHWFFEEDRDTYDPVAAELAWDRSIEFLRERLWP